MINEKWINKETEKYYLKINSSSRNMLYFKKAISNHLGSLIAMMAAELRVNKSTTANVDLTTIIERFIIEYPELVHKANRKRAINSILKRWRQNGLILDLENNTIDPVIWKTNWITNQTKEREQAMQIKKVTFINGVDIKEMDIDQKIAIITAQEDRIKKLEAVPTKSKMIQNEIDKLKQDLEEAVKLFDNLEA